jgi:hypothetical protein
MFKKIMLKKFMLFLIVVILLLGLFYAYLWLVSKEKYDVEYGISFNHQHAESLGLDWKEVYLEMLEDLKPKYIRIAAMWSEVELNQGEYDFTNVDWMMGLAEAHGTKVILVVGQKAPRWPECHVPYWTYHLDDSQYEKSLFDYVSVVVERYKDNPALEIWQVENEPFIKFRFGDCENYREDLVKKEITLVRELDSNHKILITDSGELSTWWSASRAGDLFGTTLYRIVRTPGGKIWTYDWLPASFYRIKAKLLGKDINQVYVAELQAEPWFSSEGVENTPIEEQEKTKQERLKLLGRYHSKLNFYSSDSDFFSCLLGHFGLKQKIHGRFPAQ